MGRQNGKEVGSQWHGLSFRYIWDEASIPLSGEMAKWPLKLTLFHLNSFLPISSRFKGNPKAVKYTVIQTPKFSSPASRAGREPAPWEPLCFLLTFIFYLPSNLSEKTTILETVSHHFSLWFHLNYLNFTYSSMLETFHTCTIQ